MNPFKEYLARKKSSKEYGNEFDGSDLAPEFLKFFGTKTRIKVEVDGEILHGTVGVSTGWKPVFLLMPSRRSNGSSVLLSSKYKIIAVKAPGRSRYKKI